MTEILNQGNITFEQSRRAGHAFVTIKVVEDVIGVIYAAGRGAVVHAMDNDAAWHCEFRCTPSLRVVVRIFEESLLEPVRDTLRALRFTVNSMRDGRGDYLVVLI